MTPFTTCGCGNLTYGKYHRRYCPVCLHAHKKASEHNRNLQRDADLRQRRTELWHKRL
jgi:hypothetical protein